MRKIEKAVQKQTIQTFPKDDKIHCVPYLLEKAGRDAVMSILSKYIVFKDHMNAYWTDRYWYFDVEQYEMDLVKFGIPLAVALKEPIALPEP